MRRLLLGASLALGLGGPVLAAVPTPPVVQVTGAWIREAPPEAPSMAAYVTIINNGPRDLKLEGVVSPRFERVEMHVVVEEDGLVEMQEVPGFTVKPKERLELRPGGAHLMLMGPKGQPGLGERVPLTLNFGPAGKLTISPVVSKPRRGA